MKPADEMTSPVCSELRLMWEKIGELEHERRFEGRSYPMGLAPFPGRLTGQGFFPGGDGLWREDSGLELPSRAPFPVGGIMFLANDFGTLNTFERTLRKGYENVPTWKRLKKRITTACISGDLGFYTNAVLGLRTDKKALDAANWDPDFCHLCDDFLRFQLHTMKPRLIVTLGPKARSRLFSALTDISPEGASWRNTSLRLIEVAETTQTVTWEGRKLVMHFTSHPYSDFALDIADRMASAEQLRAAWNKARSPSHENLPAR